MVKTVNGLASMTPKKPSPPPLDASVGVTPVNDSLAFVEKTMLPISGVLMPAIDTAKSVMAAPNVNTTDEPGSGVVSKRGGHEMGAVLGATNTRSRGCRPRSEL